MSTSLDALSRELAGDGAAGWCAMHALLGPPGAGKTTVTRGAVACAQEAQHRAIYIDLRPAREIWGLESFYGWLLGRLREEFGNGAIKTPARRVETVDLLAKALAKSKDRVLIVIDHLECVADWCARELVSDLREIQDRSDGRAPWNRLRCIVAGVSSVLELKRRARSPNLQFLVHTLPIWAPTPEDIESVTRGSLAAASGSLEDGAEAAFGRMCGGEEAFLRALLEQHRARNGNAGVQAAVDALIEHGGDYPEFSRPGLLYLLDDDFRRRADDLLDGRPAVWADPAADIDRYQLAGAFTCGDAQLRQVRFRNPLVAQFIATLKAGTPPAEGVVSGVSALRRLQLRGHTGGLTTLLQELDEAWSIISGVRNCGSSLVAGRRDSRTRHVLRNGGEIGLAVTLDEPESGEAMDFELRGARVRARYQEHWVLDVEFVRDDVVTGVRIDCCPEWVPSVAGREVARLWALLVTQKAGEIERIALEALGRAAAAGRLPDPRSRVFVSSTSADLREHRRAVLDQIVRLDLRFRGMEHFGADPDRNCPADKCRAAVRESDVYLGIFGMRYGSRDPATGLSMTEIELREAEKRSDMPILIYVVGRTARVEVGQVEADGEGRQKLDELIARLRARYVVADFDSAETLAQRVYQDLSKLRQ